MLNFSWEDLGEGLTNKWLQSALSVSFLFWAGGLGLFFLRFGWQPTWDWLIQLQATVQVILLIGVILLLVGSSLLVQQFSLNLLCLLEGYWPWPFRALGRALARQAARRRLSQESRWNELKGREEKSEPLSAAEKNQLARLERAIHYYPTTDEALLPSTLGNILRSAETAPAEKYGLDAYVCWPRLWLLLPEPVRDELTTAQQRLQTLVEWFAWGALFLVWTIWSPWAVLISLAWMLLMYRLLLQAARSFADLLEAAFDLYRWLLYEAMHLPPPAGGGETERTAGKHLSALFWRGE